MKKPPILSRAPLALLAFVLLAFSLSAANLLPGDTSCEISEGFFRLPWMGNSAAWTIRQSSDAPHGKQFVSHTIPAKGKSAFMGSFEDGATMDFQAGRDYVFSCWVKSSAPARMQVGLVNRDWKDTRFYDLNPTREWRRVQIPFQVKYSEPYWILLEVFTEDGAPAEVCLDGTQLEADTRTAGKYEANSGFLANVTIPSENMKVFGLQDKVTVLVNSTGYSPEITPVLCQVRITDYQGNVLSSQETVTDSAEAPQTVRASLEAPSGRPGLYAVRGVWRSQKTGGVLAECQDSYVVVRDCYAQEPDVMPYLGVTGSISPVFDRIGPKWVEVGAHMEQLMPTPDADNSEEFLQRFREFKARGYKVKFSLLHLPGTPNWAHRPEEVAEAKSWGLRESIGFAATEESLSRLSVVFENLIRRAGADIDLLEIGGEDDLIGGSEPYYRKKYPQHTIDGIVHGPVCRDIARISTVYIQAARRARPEIPIAAGRPSGGTHYFEFSRDILTQVQGDFEYFPMDCYPYGMRYINEENLPYIGSANVDFPGVFERANLMTHTYLQGQKPFVSEYGFAIDNRLPLDHPLQQLLCSRMLTAALNAKLLGSPIFYWFLTQNCVESNYFDYGLWHTDGNPTLSLPALVQLCHVVENVRECDSRLGTGETNLKLGVFAHRDHAILAIWCDTQTNPLKITFPEGTTCQDFLGNETPMPEGNRLVATQLPQYFFLQGPDAFAKLQKAMQDAENLSLSLTCHLELETPAQALLVLEDTIPNSTQEAVVQVTREGSSTATLNKKPGTPFPWKQRLSLAPGTDAMQVTLQDAKGFQSTSPLAFPSTALQKGENAIAAFGNRRQDIFPPDPHIRWTGYQDLGGEIALRVTDDTLTLIATVADDKHCNRHADYLLWDGDCFQFAIVPHVRIDQEGIARKYAPEDLEIALALTPEGPKAYVYNGSYPAERLQAGKDFQVTRNDQDGVTSYSITLDRKLLGLQDPQHLFRFSAVVMDDDEGSGHAYFYQFSPGITDGKKTHLMPIFQLP